MTALLWHTSHMASCEISSILENDSTSTDREYQKKIANAVLKTRKHLSKLKQLCKLVFSVQVSINVTTPETTGTNPDQSPPEIEHAGKQLTFETLLSRHVERASCLFEIDRSRENTTTSIVESDPVPLLSRFTTNTFLSSNWKALRGAIRFARLLKTKRSNRKNKKKKRGNMDDVLKDVDAYIRKGFIAPPDILKDTLTKTRPNRAKDRSFGMDSLLSLLQHTTSCSAILPLLIWRLRKSFFCNSSNEHHPLSNLQGCDTSDVYVVSVIS